MLKKKEILDIFDKTGAMLKGHFQLSSGLHSGQYLQCALVLQHPEYCTKLCSQLSQKFSAKGGSPPKADAPLAHATGGKKEGITAVIAPALGGIIVSYEIARFLGARSLFTERKEGLPVLPAGRQAGRQDKMVLRRGFSLSPDDKVLVVEDVITTGLSTKEVVDIVRASGAKLIGVATIVDRSTSPIDFGVRFENLVKIDIPTFQPEECPLCKEGITITKPGSRHS